MTHFLPCDTDSEHASLLAECWSVELYTDGHAVLDLSLGPRRRKITLRSWEDGADHVSNVCEIYERIRSALVGVALGELPSLADVRIAFAQCRASVEECRGKTAAAEQENAT